MDVEADDQELDMGWTCVHVRHKNTYFIRH